MTPFSSRKVHKRGSMTDSSPLMFRRGVAKTVPTQAGARPHDDGRRRGPPARNRGAESREKDRRVQRRDARNNETAAAMTPTVKNRQRDVSESLAQR